MFELSYNEKKKININSSRTKGLTRIALGYDYFRSNFDVVPIALHQQGGGNPERPLLLFVEEYRPSAAALDPDDPRQRESLQELAKRHEGATGTGSLGCGLPRARQRIVAGAGSFPARQGRKFTTRRHCPDLSTDTPSSHQLDTPVFYPSVYAAALFVRTDYLSHKIRTDLIIIFLVILSATARSARRRDDLATRSRHWSCERFVTTWKIKLLIKLLFFTPYTLDILHPSTLIMDY